MGTLVHHKQPVRLSWRGNQRNAPISVYRFPRRALTLCPQLCMGIQPGARFPVRSAALTLCPQLCMGISTRRYTAIGLFPALMFSVSTM